MSQILSDFSEPAVIAAIEANLFEAWAYLGRGSPQVELHNTPNMIRFISGTPHPLLNHVFRAQLVSDDIDGQINEILTPFKTRQLPLWWWTGPATRPTDLGKYLEVHGLTFVDEELGLAADLQALNEDFPTPPGLTIKRVGDVDILKKWTHPFSNGFEFPEVAINGLFDIAVAVGFKPEVPWRNYVGLLEGEPVACSELFLGAGVAGIYWVVTVPEARRQGIGMAMTLATLRAARALGYRIGILHSSGDPLRMYSRLGFK